MFQHTVIDFVSSEINMNFMYDLNVITKYFYGGRSFLKKKYCSCYTEIRLSSSNRSLLRKVPSHTNIFHIFSSHILKYILNIILRNKLKHASEEVFSLFLAKMFI
jgi:hypothetical protein